MHRLWIVPAAAALSLFGCDGTTGDPGCVPEGEADMVVTPSLFNYPALEDGARVPVYFPAQGGVFTELDIELSGVNEDDLGALTLTVRLDGGDVIGNPPPTMTFDLECQDDGSTLLMELVPIALNAGSPDELNQQPAALIVQLQLQGGMAPLTREFDVILDARTLN